MKQLLSFLAGALVATMITYGLMRRQSDTKPIVITIERPVKIDSIQTVIDTVEVEKIINAHKYEEQTKVILEQSDSANWDYYIHYLRTNFPDNSDTTKAN